MGGGKDGGDEFVQYPKPLVPVQTTEPAPQRLVEVPDIEQPLRSPQEDDATWRTRLRSMVDELDELERPFAAYDRERFGSPRSRQRLITAVRRESFSRQTRI